MATFCVRLFAPRPTFALDMSDAEKQLMGAHVAYAKPWFDAGKMLAWGPVQSPRDGSFGLALFDCEQAELQAFLEGDPTVKAGLMTFEIAPMRLAGVQAQKS